jgi:hypothetical protein
MARPARSPPRCGFLASAGVYDRMCAPLFSTLFCHVLKISKTGLNYPIPTLFWPKTIWANQPINPKPTSKLLFMPKTTPSQTNPGHQNWGFYWVSGHWQGYDGLCVPREGGDDPFHHDSRTGPDRASARARTLAAMGVAASHAGAKERQRGRIIGAPVGEWSWWS